MAAARASNLEWGACIIISYYIRVNKLNCTAKEGDTRNYWQGKEEQRVSMKGLKISGKEIKGICSDRFLGITKISRSKIRRLYFKENPNPKPINKKWQNLSNFP